MAGFLGKNSETEPALRGSRITFYGLALEIRQDHFDCKAVPSHIQIQGENREQQGSLSTCGTRNTAIAVFGKHSVPHQVKTSAYLTILRG